MLRLDFNFNWRN